ncbi:MAG: O-antigen ligase family protein [Candidatus Promineifilaceae bacterium]
MPIERQNRRLLTSPILEGLILVAVAPWLLFPTQAPLVTAIALVVIALLWLWPWLKRQEPFRPTPFNGALLFFEIAILVGIVVTADPDLTLPKATGVVLGLTTWRYIVMTVRDKSTLSKATAIFLLVGLGFIALGILGADWRIKLPYFESLLRRLPSQLVTLPESPEQGVQTNQLAAILLFYLPVILSLVIGWRSGRRQKPAIIILPVVLATTGALLLLTQSRSGYIGALFGVAAALLMWALTLQPSRKRTAVRLSLLALIFICLIALISIGPERLGNIWDEPAQETAIGNLGTINFRFEVWQWALVAIQDFPFTGTGLGTFRQVVHRLYPIDVQPGSDIAHAHNIFLQMGLDTGLPGLIAYLSILIIAFTGGWRTAKQDSELRPLSIGLLASLVAFHVYGMTDALALGSKPGLILWIMLGLLAAMERLSRPEQFASKLSNTVEDAPLEGE